MKAFALLLYSEVQSSIKASLAAPVRLGSFRSVLTRNRQPLDRLISICADSGNRYRRAARNVGRADLEIYFDRQAVAARHAAAELNRERIRSGGQWNGSGTLGGLLDRTAMDISVIMSAGDSGVVEWCRKDAEKVIAEYEQALAQNLPAATREIVARQLAENRATLKSFEKVLRAYGGPRS